MASIFKEMVKMVQNKQTDCGTKQTNRLLFSVNRTWRRLNHTWTDGSFMHLFFI